MSEAAVEAFADALRQELLDEGVTDVIETIEHARRRPYWTEVAKLWFTDRSKTPLTMLSERRLAELRNCDYDDLDPVAQRLKLIAENPDKLAELCAQVEEELVFQDITAGFDGD